MPIQTINPTSGTQAYSGWNRVGGTADWDVLADNDFTTFLQTPAAGPDVTVPFTDVGGVDGTSPVSSVLLQGYFQTNQDATFPITVKMRARRGGTDLDSAAMALNGSDLTLLSWNVPRPGGGAWNVSDVNGSEFGAADAAGTFAYVRMFKLWGDVAYTANPGQIEQAREIPSRRLRWWRRPNALLQMIAPLEALDAELLDFVMISHFAGPEAAGAGWGLLDWQRRGFVLLRAELDPNTNLVFIQARQLRGFLTTFWDVAWSRKSASIAADGIARLHKGNTRTFTRASKAWIEDPSDRRVVEIQNDVEKHHADGDLFEQASTNLQTRSSLVDGTTGLTLSGTGVSGSAIAVDTTDLLFDPLVTPQSLKWTAGNPHTADLSAAWPTATVTAVDHRLTIDYKEGSAASDLQWRMQRASDSNYWRDSDATWQATVQNNPFTESLTKARMFSKKFNPGSSTAVTVSVVLLSGGTASRVAWVYHVQVEASTTAIGTSRIVTSSSTVTRNADGLTISNNSGKRCWPNARVSGCCQVIPNWDSADLGAAVKQILAIVFDANNEERLFYSNGTFISRTRVGGTNYDASFTQTLVRGTVYTLAWRRTSSSGELGLANFTCSIFVNGQKGTDAVASGPPTETSPIDLEIGSRTGAQWWDGNIRQIYLTQQCLTDQEIARLP